jgi:hypothetical protein
MSRHSLIFIKDPFKKGLQPFGEFATEVSRLKLTWLDI